MWRPDLRPEHAWIGHLIPFLLLAGAVRFWDYGSMPFWNDELSALNRLNYDNFNSLIGQGIVKDAHPALTQVFLWLCTGLFGLKTWVVKLPFTLLALSSMVVLYRLAYSAFGRGAADMGAALLAVGQVFVIHSNWARPYAMGMFICSLLVWMWYRIIYLDKKGIWSHVSLAILIALAMYNHYFSGLLAILVWCSGWLYFRRLTFPYYLGSALLSAALFLPHLSITLTQIGYGGIGGWLQAPTPEFAWLWLQSNFNYSIPVMVVLSALFILRFFLGAREERDTKLSLIFICWFLITFAIGYIWSISVDPLLHHSALLFGSLFFNLGLAFFVSSNTLAGRVAPWLVAGFLLFSLIGERHSYELMRRQLFATTASALYALNGKNASAIISQNPAYLDFYFHDNEPTTPFENLADPSLSIGHALHRLASSQRDYFYSDGRVPSITLGAREIFGSPEVKNGFTFSEETFSRIAPKVEVYSTLSAGYDSTSFDGEYFNLFQINLEEIAVNYPDELGAIMRFAERPVAGTLLVFDFLKNGTSLHWTASDVTDMAFILDGKTVFPYQILLWNIFNSREEMEGVELKIYLWNQAKNPLHINSWEVVKMDGNPMRYTLFNRWPQEN